MIRNRPLIVILLSTLTALSTLTGCAAESTDLETVPSLAPITVEAQRGILGGLTCPSGSKLCKTVCCPDGSFCTILRDGTELCQVSPIDPKVSLAETTSKPTADGGAKQDYYKVTLENVFVSSY